MLLLTDGAGQPGETEGQETGENPGEEEEGARTGEGGKETVLPQEV